MDEADDAIEPLSEGELNQLPVFPLPRAVFFPHTELPLHVFEVRYRQMVEDCLDEGPLAMIVALLEPGWEQDYGGKPPVCSIAGAGRIVAHEQLADGRHNIVVRGLSRVRLEELDAGPLPYRIARASVLEEHGSASSSDVTALLSCAAPIVAAVRREHPEFALDVDPGDSPGRIADRTADRLVADVDARQRILETLDVAERIRLVTEQVGELMAMLSARHDKKADLLD